MMTGGGGRVTVDRTGFDRLTEPAVVTAVCRALERGEGGRIITPNVDVLRLARRDPAVRAHIADATLVVADGMPVVWAARLAGDPLPQRVSGACLAWSLAYHLGRAGRSVYVIGGEPAGSARAAAPGGAGSRRAAAVLAAACPGLRIAGHQSPPYGFERHPVIVAEICARVVETKPDLVLVGLGFPRQERLIDRLRPLLPMSWFLGCGQAVGLVAGDLRRAPERLQRVGLEWAWRLATDPRRLAARYLCHDLPYALRLLGAAAAGRLCGAGRRRGGRGCGAGGERTAGAGGSAVGPAGQVEHVDRPAVTAPQPACEVIHPGGEPAQPA